MVLSLAVAASAQRAPATLGPCDVVLGEAERLYLEQMYEDAERSALECVRISSATPPDIQEAHRLLALIYLKRGLLTEARLTIVKMLGADYTYRADSTTDLPAYVALVDAIRGQLRVAPSVRSGPEEVSTPGARRVNVNTASAEELDTVPGIGPALAARIIAHRDQNGAFRSVSDLQDVRGIGPRSIERMAPSLTVTGDTVTGDTPAQTESQDAPTVTAPTVVVTSRQVDLNTATAQELESLPGIGPALAGRIIAFRNEHGPFRSTDEVMLVRGIGEGTFEAIADLITVQ